MLWPRPSSSAAVAYAGLVLLVAPRPVFPVVVDRPEMLGIMAVMDQKDCIALSVSGSGMCKARVAGILHLTLCSSLGCQAHDVPHRGRYEPEGQLRGEILADGSDCRKTVIKVVDISFVLQRLIPMVLATSEIPQLRVDKVVDAPFYAGRADFLSWCRGRFPWSRLFCGPWFFPVAVH